MSEGAATPHCAALVFFLLAGISLLCMGALRGFGIVTPDVSEVAETSTADGDIVYDAWGFRLRCFSRSSQRYQLLYLGLVHSLLFFL